jgi:hypothetical protein
MGVKCASEGEGNKLFELTHTFIVPLYVASYIYITLEHFSCLWNKTNL